MKDRAESFSQMDGVIGLLKGARRRRVMTQM